MATPEWNDTFRINQETVARFAGFRELDADEEDEDDND